MGLEIQRERFSKRDFARFQERLERCLVVLEAMVERPGFGVGPPSIGAELEVALIDARGRALPLNESVLRETVDERMTLELDRFNLECNLRHAGLAGRPFGHLRRELESAQRALGEAAALHGGRIVTIGILPTLCESDLQREAMTDQIRYRALSRALRGLRHAPFRLDIAGEDQLQRSCEDVTFEGAATSFQIHLRVQPEDFVGAFNATQLATAPVLAAAGNSPSFLGHRLWHETRVALFKQAVDARDDGLRRAGSPPRVGFGSGWLERGPVELFREAATRFPVLLPVVYDQDPDEALRAGETPRLDEIRLHQGTVWHWNRPVYDPHDGGHVRLEMRALPSGPTTTDMLANAAFAVGLAVGLAPRMDAIRRRLDFETAHHNFYRAAQSGLDATLAWPDADGEPRKVRTGELVAELLGIAREGLERAGIESDDHDPLLDCLRERVECGQTGAVWQRRALASLERTRPREEALVAMLEHYVERSAGDEPVHRWDVP